MVRGRRQASQAAWTRRDSSHGRMVVHVGHACSTPIGWRTRGSTHAAARVLRWCRAPTCGIAIALPCWGGSTWRRVGGQLLRRPGSGFGRRPVAESLVRPMGVLGLGGFGSRDRTEPRGLGSDERAKRERCLCFVARLFFEDGVVPSS